MASRSATLFYSDLESELADGYEVYIGLLSAHATLTLADVSSSDGAYYSVINSTSSNSTLTVEGCTAQTINGQASFDLAPGEFASVISFGGLWYRC